MKQKSKKSHAAKKPRVIIFRDMAGKGWTADELAAVGRACRRIGK
jgi:hypothetical protein